MSSHISKCLRFSAAALLAAGATAAAYAQTAPGGTLGTVYTSEQFQAFATEIIAPQLPPILAGDNSELAGRLLKAPIAPPLGQTFSVPTAVEAVFGRAQPVFDPNCSRVGTAVGEPDQGDCNGTAGTANGKGAFIQLGFSKNIAVGNIRFLKRSPDTGKANVVAVTITDAAALSQAVSFLSKSFGLPPTEFPLPPTPVGAAGPNLSGFVSSLTIQGNSDAGEVTGPTIIGKLVHIRRGLHVSLPTDPNGNTETYVPVPGVAKVLIDSTGIVGAMVEDWRELRVDPNANPALAKSKETLANEIAQDLLAEGAARIAHISAHIVYGVDCRSAGFCYLVPAVEVYVAPATGNLDADQLDQVVKGSIGTAGFVKQYALIAPDSELLPAR